MTEQTSNTVKTYLARLDAALAGVDPDVRFEIVSGIREELAGLDEQAAAARIAEMDDPALIAAEARAEMPPPPMPPAPAVAEPVPGRAFSITAVIVLIVGTFVVPVIGPLVGLVWVSMAKAWTRREKIVAWARPISAGLIVLALSFVTSLFGQNQQSGTNQPVLAFAFVAQWHLVLIVMFLVLPIEGIVLLVRANKRGWRAPAQP
ncbi:HAAS signaling domain-containing protein [Agreia pratensis]|uniref:Uncharacterized membrane protein n=1 Tax=Agreia pratensis TaxID=150121 RepID=A0A1X7KVT6_9MICO|nr:hypothetical protein [Agreia pratensis]SMG45359.1 Uncharacterized membrane protein [Agreia pratensis]